LGIYVWAVSKRGCWSRASGYFINPLVNVLLGVLASGAPESRQWIAVGLAALESPG